MILLRPILAPALKKGSTSYIKHPSHFEILKREKKEKSGCTNKTFPLHTPSKPFRRSVPLQPCFMPSFLSAVCLHTAASFYFFFPFTCPLTLLSGDSLKTACSTDCSDCGWCRLGGHRITDTRCINYPPPKKNPFLERRQAILVTYSSENLHFAHVTVHSSWITCHLNLPVGI